MTCTQITLTVMTTPVTLDKLKTVRTIAKVTALLSGRNATKAKVESHVSFKYFGRKGSLEIKCQCWSLRKFNFLSQ